MAELRKLTVEELLTVIPAIAGVDQLRLLIRESAVLDPDHKWSRAEAYATADTRVVSGNDILALTDRAEQRAVEQLRLWFATARSCLEQYVGGDVAAVALKLVEWGERCEIESNLEEAKELYGTALSLSLPLPRKWPHILALCRLGRLHIAAGELPEASVRFARAAELAGDDNDPRGRAIALTGLGNVLKMQGRWSEMEAHLKEALATLEASTGEPYPLERGHVINNLAMVATRLEKYEEAEQWFTLAQQVWAEVDSPVDLAICLHNLGILRARQGRLDDARHQVEKAAEIECPARLRAAFTTDLALMWLKEGDVAKAKRWARRAEDAAIEARSPYYLGHTYCGLGMIAREAGEQDGFVFFERALQIARENQLSYLEGITLREYAFLRDQMGGRAEAVAYLEEARKIFSTLGTLDELTRTEEAFHQLTPEQLLPEKAS